MTSISKMALASALCAGVAFALGFVFLLAVFGVVIVNESFHNTWILPALVAAIVSGVSGWTLGLAALDSARARREERRGRTLARVGTYLGGLTTLAVCIVLTVSVVFYAH